jgi:endoglucanase
MALPFLSVTRFACAGCLSLLGLAVPGWSNSSADRLPPFALPTLSGTPEPGLPPVTGRIHVDQFGYLPDAPKIAVLSDPQRGYNAHESYTPAPELEVRRAADGAVVWRGEPRIWNNGAVHESSGDRGWHFDFSAVTEPGRYYIYDPVAGLRSPAFRIAADVYHPALRAAVRTYYYQRLGVPREPPYAEAPWIDGPAFLQDREARYVGAKDDPAAARDLSGGWMDAGDTNKYPTFLANVIHPLLHAWRENPAAFGDDFGIPESGNGLPDLLDEVKFELDWLVKMQDDDGGFYIKMGNVDYNVVTPLSLDRRPRYYGPKCSSSTLCSAGVLAHAARVYGRFPEWAAFAADLHERALRAWQWYESHPRRFDCDSGEIKSGNADRGEAEHDRLEAVAAAHLFALTGEQRFHDLFQRRLPTLRSMREWPWSPYEAGAGEVLIDYLGLPGADPATAEAIRDHLRASMNHPHYTEAAQLDLYRAAMADTAYHWGSNFVRAAVGIVALNALSAGAHDAPADVLRARALDQVHSFHGVNPLSVVYLTNMERHGATLSVRRIWHDWFSESSPFAANPPPGYVVGGPNQNFGGHSRDGQPDRVGWITAQPRAKAYADFNAGWPENSWELTENAIYYQAVYIRLLSAFARPAAHTVSAATAP